jgi:hypothetical protein
MRPLDDYIRKQLDEHLGRMEGILSADVMAILGPIVPGLEITVRQVIEKKNSKKTYLAIILDTPGGIVEVVERIVETIRQHYEEVAFIIPNRAMSAGTVFAMSGDRIMMDYFSCLGPIDPQIERDNKLVPALSYLNQFERLNEKAAQGKLTSAEYGLLNKMDLGELYQFEQARELSRELLVKWLSKYKFKNWKTTETRGQFVTPELKEARANEIADALSNASRWHSHGRGINMKTITDELNLKIDDYTKIKNLGATVREYFELLGDYMARGNFPGFVHSKEYF